MCNGVPTRVQRAGQTRGADAAHMPTLTELPQPTTVAQPAPPPTPVVAEEVVVPTASYEPGYPLRMARVGRRERILDLSADSPVGLAAAQLIELPFADASFDVVISNGVLSIAASRTRLLAEVARVLRPAGRLVVADMVAEYPAGSEIQRDDYLDEVTAAGLDRQAVRPSRSYALGGDAYSAKAVTVRARKPLETGRLRTDFDVRKLAGTLGEHACERGEGA